MNLRKLDPEEKWSGVHNIEAVAPDGNVLARYACPCQWCELWQAAQPMMEAAMVEMDRQSGIATLGMTHSDTTPGHSGQGTGKEGGDHERNSGDPAAS